MLKGPSKVKRSSKDIGSSLEADIEIYLGKEYIELVKDINLSEYFLYALILLSSFLIVGLIFLILMKGALLLIFQYDQSIQYVFSFLT